MCGKSNPAEAETCQFCQARLKPLGTGSGGEPAVPDQVQPASQTPADGDETDWLRGLLGSDSSPEAMDENNEQPHQEADDNDADWLERIRQRTQEEQDSVSKIGPKPKIDSVHPQDAESTANANELENWLKSLDGSESAEAPVAGTPPSPPAQVPPPAVPEQNLSEDDDDWLRSLTARIEASQSMEDHLQTFRGGPESEPDQPPAEPAEGVELPDWLNNSEAGKAGESNPAGEPPAEETAGWLKDFGQAGEDSSEVSGDELPDWAKNLPDQDGETPTSASEAAAADEIPDWLRELREEPPAAEAPPEPAAPSEELPDWLSTGEPPQAAAQDSAAAEEIPDWLTDLKMDQPEEENPPPDQPEASAPAEELPDWMKDFQQVEEKPSQLAPEESLPDWMGESVPSESEDLTPSAAETSDIPQWMSEYSAPAEEETSAVPAQDDQEIPDWLRNFQDVPAAETGQEPAEETLQPSEMPESPSVPDASQPGAETPDWLKDLGPLPADAESAPEEPTAEDQPAAETPDWLNDLGPLSADADSASEEPIAENQPAAETPDWLKDLGPLPADAESAPEEPTAEEQPAAETPDWLKDLGTLPGAEAEPASSAETVSGWLDNLDEPEAAAKQTGGSGLEEAAPAEDIPDWLKAIKTGSQSEDETGSNFGAQGLPAWMNNPEEIESKWDEPSRPEGPPAESVSPFASSEMDALLADVTPAENTAQPASPEGEAESLEPAQLPSWLQAMRPVESAVSDIPAAVAVDDQRIEKAGPLAGLRGVLPGEELANNYRKPPVYTNKLQVSEKQHLHSNLLESILADEARSQAVPGEATGASQTIIRLLVAALLIFLVYVPSLTGFNLEVPADLSASQPGVAQTFQSISELAPGANILLAADFEAGLTGEITTAALPVLKYLQTRQPNVIVASTVPVGPVLGETLLSQASITPVASFGYIAGGTHALKMIGLHATEEQPAPLQQVIPFPYGQGWNDAVLQGIHDITGFQRIIVLTDSLENARAWVEQVQPGLGSQTQILIVSSAQVAPLVRTYFESGQVSGVVSGLLGGMSFEQLSQQSGPGGASWTAYQLTMGAVILLIIAGALATGISSLLRPEKSKRKV